MTGGKNLNWKKYFQVVWIVWACMILTGCTFPGYMPPGPPDVDASVPMHSTATASPGAAANVPVMQTESGGICDRAAPGLPIDVTVPDGTVFRPGEEFTKIWRLVNAGNCAWSEDYAILWFSGEPMGSARILYLDVPVHPGESVDLSVAMAAPQQNGLYQSNWKMRNAEGELFGLGPQGNAPFWVRIHVYDGSTPTANPAPTHTPIAMIYQQGEVGVAEEIALDFDSGGMDMGDDSDVSLGFEDGQVTVLPLGDVKMGLTGGDAGMPPAQNDCIQTPLSGDTIVLEDLTADVFICYQSSQGLPGYLWVKSTANDADYPDVAFVTWFIP